MPIADNQNYSLKEIQKFLGYRNLESAQDWIDRNGIPGIPAGPKVKVYSGELIGYGIKNGSMTQGDRRAKRKQPVRQNRDESGQFASSAKKKSKKR